MDLESSKENDFNMLEAEPGLRSSNSKVQPAVVSLLLIVIPAILFEHNFRVMMGTFLAVQNIE